MPVDDFLKNYKPGDDFTFESFRDQVAAEYARDQTAWRAAVTTRDETITQTAADLQKAQSYAWQLQQQQPVNEPAQQTNDTDDDNSETALRARVFRPLERK